MVGGGFFPLVLSWNPSTQGRGGQVFACSRQIISTGKGALEMGFGVQTSREDIDPWPLDLQLGVFRVPVPGVPPTGGCGHGPAGRAPTMRCCQVVAHAVPSRNALPYV